MKFYDLETVFTFGKFEGKTVTEILNIGQNGTKGSNVPHEITAQRLIY